MSNLLRSLILTAFLTFTAPIVLLGSFLAALFFVSLVPGFAFLGQAGTAQLLDFLTIFGNGYPLDGVLTIGLTCSMVGGAFDIFNFYFYQS